MNYLHLSGTIQAGQPVRRPWAKRWLPWLAVIGIGAALGNGLLHTRQGGVPQSSIHGVTSAQH